MPPKKADKGGAKGSSSKTTVDKTFGMKNKKGAKGQQAVKRIQGEMAQIGKTPAQLAKEKQRQEEKKLKEAADKMRREQAATMTIVQPKVPFGVDPKTITCEFWKAGVCEKGNKCKFAHTDEAARKGAKKDLYVDTRDKEREEKEKDTMDTWDEEKLNQVVLSKQGNAKTTTDKVCKFFLAAVESNKYGWFWDCPSGENCMYRHRLPPGFVLKAQRKEQEALEKANEISLEDFLEVERHKLGKDLTPVTPETFAEWKKARVDKKTAEEELMRDKKTRQAQLNKMNGLSGREMFELNPDMLEDDDSDAGEFDMRQYLGREDWEQDRQSEQGEEGVSEGEDQSEDEQEQQTHDAADKVADLSINGDEGEEEGKRK